MRSSHMRPDPRLLLLLLMSVALPLIGCGSDDDPIAPPTPDPMARIAIMHDDSTHVMMIAILTTAGYDVTDLGLYSEYTEADFSAFDLVFLLTGYEYGAVLPDSVQQGLLDFMDGGGTLVTNEWLGYSENNDLLQPVLPLLYNEDYCDDGDSTCIDVLTVERSHALTAGLPGTFNSPEDYTYSYMVLRDDATSANAVNLLTGDQGGAMLGVADWGAGHTIHWNSGGTYGGPNIWDANTTRILLNIADFAR